MYELFIVETKKTNNIHIIDTIFELDISPQDILHIKNPEFIEEFLRKYEVPFFDTNEFFFYLNTTNIDFNKYEIINFHKTPDNNHLRINIDTKLTDDITSYYKFFKQIIINRRKFLLDASDWIFTNISDKTIHLSNEEIEKAKKLRNELRNYFDNKDVKRDLIYINMGWSFTEEFYNKYKYLCEL